MEGTAGPADTGEVVVGTEVTRLRREVGAEVDALARRVDRILGAAIVDLSERLGEELVELRTRAALARDERRSSLRLEMRMHALEERLAELVQRRQQEELAADRARDAIVGALEGLVPELRSAVAPIQKAVALLEEGQRHLAERVRAAETTIGDELRSVLATDAARLGALHAELTARIDDLLSEGVVGLARVAQRLESTAEAMPAELGRELSGALDRATDETVRRVEDGVRAVETRVATQVGDRLASTEAGVVDRMASLDERLDAFAEILRQHDDRDLNLSDDDRRALIADLAAALDGSVCRTCGFVAKNAAGLASHERTHER